ncbi:hypothetical protein [Streptomyces flavidovirens]|uniref:hypothetical protein n=1 Tax=Streptomyces flavidovirens TaxID=67298 RepID=UPI0036B70450
MSLRTRLVVSALALIAVVVIGAVTTITTWVEDNFTTVTVDGTALYDLTGQK